MSNMNSEVLKRYDMTVDNKFMDLPIKGYVPMALDDTFAGCKFYTRCPYSSNQCREQYPEMQEVGEGHRASCFILNQ